MSFFTLCLECPEVRSDPTEANLYLVCDTHAARTSHIPETRQIDARVQSLLHKDQKILAAKYMFAG